MDGHAVQVGEAIVDSGNFDWTNGKFPDLAEPDERDKTAMKEFAAKCCQRLSIRTLKNY